MNISKEIVKVLMACVTVVIYHSLSSALGIPSGDIALAVCSWLVCDRAFD